MNYTTATKQELQNELTKLLLRFEEYKNLSLKLDMSRGKPCAGQMDLSEGLLTVVSKNEDCFSEQGLDVIN